MQRPVVEGNRATAGDYKARTARLKTVKRLKGEEAWNEVGEVGAYSGDQKAL